MAKTKEIYLSDYTPPDCLVDRVALDVDIRDDHARVTSRLEISPQSEKQK